MVVAGTVEEKLVGFTVMHLIIWYMAVAGTVAEKIMELNLARQRIEWMHEC